MPTTSHLQRWRGHRAGSLRRRALAPSRPTLVLTVLLLASSGFVFASAASPPDSPTSRLQGSASGRAAADLALATSGGDLLLRPWAVFAGGGTSRQDELQLDGTIGPPVTTPAWSEDGELWLDGGILPAGGDDGIFADGFENGTSGRWNATVPQS